MQKEESLSLAKRIASEGQKTRRARACELDDSRTAEQNTAEKIRWRWQAEEIASGSRSVQSGRFERRFTADPQSEEDKAI